MSDNTITVDASSVPATITTSGHTSDLRVPVVGR